MFNSKRAAQKQAADATYKGNKRNGRAHHHPTDRVTCPGCGGYNARACTACRGAGTVPA